MAEISVAYINPFLAAASKILKDMCNVESKVGKPYLKNNSNKTNGVMIMVGVTGDIRGQVIISLEEVVALDIASKMCMMQVTEIDDLVQSALSEFGNMILGNAATLLFSNNIGIDITPPTVYVGDVTVNNMHAQMIGIPITYDDCKEVELDVSLSSTK